MGYTIRDIRSHEPLTDTVYGQKSSAKRAFNSRLLTPEKAYIADEDWRIRESVRANLINLEQFGLPNIPDHFLHVSAKSTYEDFLISYTENEVKGRMDRQSPGRKIGRYLKEFFPNLDSEKLNKLTHEITATINKMPIDFARSPEDIAAIYTESGRTEGMSSCMTHAPGHWGMKDADRKLRHPTEAYGGGDLALAYMRVNGKITARVLVWEAKKRYSRIYGPDSSKIETLLMAAGYKQDTLHGAALLSVKIPDYTSSSEISLLAPYTDRDRYVYLDEKDVLRVGNGLTRGLDYRETSTSGMVLFRVMLDAVTGERIKDGTAVTHPYSGDAVYVSAAHINERTVEYRGYRYAKVEYPTDGMSNKIWIQPEGATQLIPYTRVRREYVLSAFSRRWFKPDDMIAIRDGSRVAIAEFIEHYERCEMTGCAELRKNMTLMPHGKYWHRDAVALYATFKGTTYVSNYHPNQEQAA